MSVILNLNKNLSNLADYLEKYSKDIENFEKNLSLKNKNIQTACLEQPAWSSYYDQIRVELETLCDFLELKVKESRSSAFKTIIEHSKISYSERQIERMIDGDPKYISLQTLYLETRELYLKTKSIVSQFEQRGYALNNIVKIRVAQLEDVILTE